MDGRPNQIPNKYNQEYINQLLFNLTDSICKKNNEEAQNFLSQYLEMKPSCKVELNLTSKNQHDSKFYEYLNHQNNPNPPTIDKINQEIYNKLKNAGNKEYDSKFAATGVKTMEEAMEKLKKK